MHVKETPGWERTIQPGLDKLEEYMDRLNDAHVLAMGEINLFNLIYNIY